MALLTIKRQSWRARLLVFMLSVFIWPSPASAAEEALLTSNEKALKVAFVYNFALFTEWPADVGSTLNLCLYGAEPFGKAMDELQGKAVGTRHIVVLRKNPGDSLKSCQIVFISAPAINGLAHVLDELRERPVLTIADSPGAARQGVALNMAVIQNRVTFEANLQAARAARLNISSKLLRLATEVQP